MAEKTALEKLQDLYNNTHSQGFSHPTAKDMFTAATDFICTDLKEVIEDTIDREAFIGELEKENIELRRQLLQYGHKAAS